MPETMASLPPPAPSTPTAMLPAIRMVRILPRADWTRLAGTELAYLVPYADVDGRFSVQVFVVEEDGRITACWARMAVEHLEGLWVAPEARGNPAVAKLLLGAMVDSLTADGFTQVVTQSNDELVDRLLQHVGATPIPGRAWTIPLLPPTIEEHR